MRKRLSGRTIQVSKHEAVALSGGKPLIATINSYDLFVQKGEASAKNWECKAESCCAYR